MEDNGGGIQRGANWGPLFLRLAYYQQANVKRLTELGDVRVIPQLLLDEYVSEAMLISCRQHLYGDAAAAFAVSPLSIALQAASSIYQVFPQAKLLGIGGDHSASYPLVKAKLEAARQSGQRLGVIHFDAHTDLLLDRMGLPVTFGSWVPHVLQLLPTPSQWVQIGIRQTSKDRNHWETTQGIRQYWASEIQQQGTEAIVEQILQQFKAQSIDGLYITVDIDSLDACYASATGTPETGGMCSEDVVAIIRQLAAEIPVHAADMMEFAPMVHQPDRLHQPEPATTLTHILPIYSALVEVLKSKS